MDASVRGLLGWCGLLLGTAGLLAGIASCGPIRSTSSISQAEVELERARVNEAYQKSPYEFFSARYYLHKAKEEWGYSEFEASFDYADEAKDAAESARRRAEEDPWEDPIEGREKTYELKPQETITIDPGEVEETEGTPERTREREGSGVDTSSSGAGESTDETDEPSSGTSESSPETDESSSGDTLPSPE